MSKFVFGTASLFNVGGSSQRRDLLAAAVDNGFTHFDTAPYYGFGIAERDLAPVLKRHPDVTVTTKVGIYSPGGEAQPAATVFLRKAAGRILKPISRPTIDFSLSRAQTALEGSLRRLGRDMIDIYMLHEPELALIETEEWHRWLENLVEQGKVRTFGLALTEDRLLPFLDNASPLCRVVQMADSLSTREADILPMRGKPLQITYGYVTAERRKGLGSSVENILKAALRRNADGAVIVSTTKVSRLPQYSELCAETDVDL
ncbi:aldo/keto reductase [Novosphingobium resinovorum]|uniref:aldo/keto reductase n=1 Tax=Novosphingobium TaxID=165696 RepID=UPI001B3C88A4|nr:MULTISPECIES: aldo/keto reductase [Novosphingobium]MBF7012787.1 aldo/keto reductase [Novosphingobium sp. HR1a]WJM27521.1 aldo/keto reductase [Novosphingobium resinovorum]